MKKFLALFLALALPLFCFACSSDELFSVEYNTRKKADIEVDFSQKDGSNVQNLLKFDVFTPTWFHTSGGQLTQTGLEQLQYLAPLKTESYRVDSCVYTAGGVGYSKELNEGNWDNPDVTLSRMYTFADKLYESGTMPYYALLGNPKYVWAENGTQSTLPNMTAYTEYLKTLAKAFKDSGRRVTFETWNEPDLADSYFQGGMINFVNMSVQGAAALKQGNEDATVSEMALCYPNSFCNNYYSDIGGSLFDYYMEKNEEYNNVVDYFSWHYYGGVYGNMEGNGEDIANFSYFKNIMRNKINEASKTYDLHTMSQHVTEFSGVAQKASDVMQSGLVGKSYDTIDAVLKATDISRVSWCGYYFTNSGYSLINANNEKRPAYHVLWSYARLPQANAKVTFNTQSTENSVVDGDFDTFSVRTGVDDHRASAIVCNNVLNPKYIAGNITEYPQRLEDSRTINVKLKNIPFDAKSLDVYLIDGEGKTTSTEPYKVLNVSDLKIKNNQTTLSLKIPGNSAFYIELNDATGLGERDVKSNLKSHILKKTYYYDNRFEEMPYADLYEEGYSVALGMLNNQTGKTAICVTMDKMNDYSGVEMKWNLFSSSTGTVGVRVDFHTADGYVSSKTYYHGQESGFTYSRFGTGKDTDAYVKMATDNNFKYTIDLVNDAPAGWDGKIQMTYFMKDAGVNNAASVVCKGI